MLSRRQLRRTAIRGVLIALVALLGLVVIGLLIASLLLALLSVASPAVATLLTALLLAAFCLLLGMFLASDRRRHGGVMRDADRLLAGLFGLVRRRPMGAAGAALALGVVTELLQREGKRSDKRRSGS